MPLSSRQMEYLALAWQCFETEPKIDYEKFCQVAGLKTPHSARELMRVTKNKLKTEYGALSGSVQAANTGNANGEAGTPSKASSSVKGTPIKGTPTKGRSRTTAPKTIVQKRGADVEVAGDRDDALGESDASTPTPTPTPRKRVRVSESVATAGVQVNDERETVTVARRGEVDVMDAPGAGVKLEPVQEPAKFNDENDEFGFFSF